MLHTRDSLERLLAFCGFIDITVQSAQRYSLANHMNWMQNDLPGGHKTLLSVLENKTLNVLVENLTDDKMQVFGRSEYMTPVKFNGTKNVIGKIVSVKITHSNRSTLFGEIINSSNQRVA